MTLLCVPIMVEDTASALADAAAAKSAGADLVEFRIDGFFSGSGAATAPSARSPGPADSEPDEVRQVVRLVSESPLPCVVTCRTTAEGGLYDGDEQARVSLFERLGTAGVGETPSSRREHPPRYIDVELARYAASANIRQKVNLAVQHPAQPRQAETSLILSLHDFNGRPADLTRRLLRIADEPAAAVAKVVYRARSLRDNLELFDILVDNAASKPTIALAMGEFGLMSRVLAPKFGGFLTFASLRDSAATAPGQPTIDELLNLYRFRSIGPRTKVYGVVGWPAAQSLSPAMHSLAFARPDHPNDGVYLPLPIPPEYEHFKATMLALIEHPRLDFAGCSVTMPHKEHMVRLARECATTSAPHRGCKWELDAIAEACGAANTLSVERDRSGAPTHCRVGNTDGPAAVTLLTEQLGTLEGRRVVILGAGGTARSIAAALLLAGAHVSIANRTAERAASLVTDLRQALLDTPPSGTNTPMRASIQATNEQSIAASQPDAIINCTSIGMAGGSAPTHSAISRDTLRNCPRHCIVLECVYTPVRTPTLFEVTSAGLNSIDGLSLLAQQASMQSAKWTGAAPARDLMLQAARRAAAGREGGGDHDPHDRPEA